MIYRTLVVLCLGVLMTACAAGRGEVDVRIAAAANPDSTALVKITEVADRRVFELAPPTPSTPSLKDGEITDPTITKRAIARKRNGFGMALGDILLPEGRSVSQLTREALTKALQEVGYRVVAEGDPGYGGARALTAKIVQFWAWFTPGAFTITVEHRTQILLDDAWPVAGDQHDLGGHASVSSLAATTAVWEETLQASLANLIENLKSALKPAGQISRSRGTPVS